MAKTIRQINEKIRSGEVVVVNAEEIIDIVRTKGAGAAAEEVDIVTTGTFGPMCSSGAYFNVGHTKPRMKFGGGKVTLNDVPAYTGVAAVDFFLGATAIPDDDPRNRIYPGEFAYGGGHVIEDLVNGKDVRLCATAHGTDCYPRKRLDTHIALKDMNEAVLLNMRNCYQNYNAAVNVTSRSVYTYMGMLKPNMANINYCSAGRMSPLLNDPHYKAIGIGSRIFLGGGEGYIFWQGTQFNPHVKRKPNGVPCSPAGTLGLYGDLAQMSGEWLVGASFLGYGATLIVGIGIPIPVLNEEIVKYAAVDDDEIYTQVVDYGSAYGAGKAESIAEVSYRDLKSGIVTVKGKRIPTASLSSYSKAVEIAEILKRRICDKKFFLSESVAPLPGVDSKKRFTPLNERPIR